MTRKKMLQKLQTILCKIKEKDHKDWDFALLLETYVAISSVTEKLERQLEYEEKQKQKQQKQQKGE